PCRAAAACRRPSGGAPALWRVGQARQCARAAARVRCRWRAGRRRQPQSRGFLGHRRGRGVTRPISPTLSHNKERGLSKSLLSPWCAHWHFRAELARKRAMITVILVVHLMIAAALIGVILLQKSEGGALGMGGGGMSGFMTGRSTANLLTRTTAILAAVFFLTSIVLALLA